MSYLLNSSVDEYGDITYTPTALGITVLVLIMLALLILGSFIFGGRNKFSAKKLAFCSIALALATVTSFIKIIPMPMGGSVTLLSMLFIVLVGYWYGLGTGLTTAIAYGLLQLTIDPYILSAPQAIVDYIFAFGALGLAGIFYKNKSKFSLQLCYIVGVLGRYFFSFLSGWIFFGTYAGDYGFSSGVIYSLAYNGAYLGLEAAITLILITIPAVSKGLKAITRLAQEQ